MSEVFEHKTVLLEEAVNALDPQPDGVYVDGTFGRGGHSRAILARLGPNGRLIGFDKDPAAIAEGERLSAADQRFCMIGRDFSTFDTELDQLGAGLVDGVLLDLGVSSPQLDDAARGFSFRYNAPLDMRMDTRSGLSAAAWLSSAAEAEIKEVIKDYGEERFAGKIAAAIVARRAIAPLETTRELAQLVAENVRTREPGQNPATRTFQAIRIHINGELTALQQVLPQAARRLREGGILAVISFHSLEDRIVKHFMRDASAADQLPSWVAVRSSDLPEPPMQLEKRARRASSEEIAVNPRARSAILRVARRTNGPWSAGA